MGSDVSAGPLAVKIANNFQVSGSWGAIRRLASRYSVGKRPTPNARCEAKEQYDSLLSRVTTIVVSHASPQIYSSDIV